jgi:hypothetical protein
MQLQLLPVLRREGQFIQFSAGLVYRGKTNRAPLQRPTVHNSIGTKAPVCSDILLALVHAWLEVIRCPFEYDSGNSRKKWGGELKAQVQGQIGCPPVNCRTFLLLSEIPELVRRAHQYIGSFCDLLRKCRHLRCLPISIALRSCCK